VYFVENIIKLRAVFAILATTMFWGFSFTSTKVLLGSLLPPQIAFLRLVLAVSVLGLCFALARKPLVSKAHLLRVAAGGTFGTLLYFLFENNGLRYTTAGTGSLIVSTIPVVNVVAGALFFRERHSLQRWTGVLLSFLGVYLIISSGSAGSLSPANLRGNLLVFLAGCSWVAYTRINEPLTEKYDSITLNFHQSLVGVFLFAMIVLPGGLNPAAFTAPVVLNLAYLGVFCSAVAYFFYLYALRGLGSATVTSFLNLVPVFGVLGGAVILGEAVAAGQLFGGAVVITGVSLVTMSGKIRQSDKELEVASG
jgi:drug/metabolite transporter (DMT)-like permease